MLIDDDPSSKTCGPKDSFYKHSNGIKMSGLETFEKLYKALTVIYLNQARVAHTGAVGVWHQS